MKENKRKIIKETGIPEYYVEYFAPKKHKYAVIPITWNEGTRIKNQLQRMQEQLNSVDLILCDGNSTDGSTEHKFLQEQNVRSLITVKELGIGTAIRAALAYALSENYAGIIIMDGNGKDDVAAITTLVDYLDQGYGFVQASRFKGAAEHRHTPLDRLLAIKLIAAPLISIASGFRFTDPTNGFKAMSREFLLDKNLDPLRKEFKRFNMQFYLNYKAPKLAYKVTEIPASRNYPDDGTVPTKIHGLRVKLLMIYELLATIMGKYNA